MERIIKDTTANPAPLGLLGFGLTTVLLNLHNAGLFELNVMIMAMGIFYGGIAQLIAGILESKKGNTFGAIAFISYGSFWLTLVAIWTLPLLGLPKASPVAMGWYLLMWGIMTFGMFLATLSSAKISQFVFAALTILFVLLAISDFTGNHTLHTIAGYEGILTGALAMYDAFGQIINEAFKKDIVPLGKKK